MSRLTRDVRLETREARSRLKQQHEPYWRLVHQGLYIGYRKGPRGGVWFLRRLVGRRYLKSRLGLADDTRDANGAQVLSYKQAHKKATGNRSRRRAL